jgi:excisionase family DNA binding protein
MEELKEMMSQVLSRLDDIEEKIRLGNADTYTTEELAKVLGISKAEIYKMTAKNEIPCHRPTGRRLIFKRKEINRWVSLSKKSNE